MVSILTKSAPKSAESYATKYYQSNLAALRSTTVPIMKV